MEYGHPVGPHRGTVLDHNPQRPLYDDPAAGVGSVPEGEEEHHEKTPVLKKVKNKVKKLKDAITKKRQAHDDIHEVYVEEEDDEDAEVDLEVHGTPKYQSGNTQLGTAELTEGVTLGTGGNIPYEHPQGVTLLTGRDFSEVLGVGGNIPYEHPQGIGGNIPYETGRMGTGGNIPYSQGVGGNILYEHPEGVPLRTGRDVSGALGTGGNIPYEHPEGVPLRTGWDVSGALGTGGNIPHPQGVGGNIPYEHPEGVSLRTGRDVSGALGTGGNIRYERPEGVPLRTGRDVSGALGTGGNISYEYPQGVPLQTGRNISGALGTGQNIPYEHQQGVGRNSPSELSGALGTGRDEHLEIERLTLEAVMVTTLEEDPAAPLSYSSVPLTTGVQIDRPTQARNTRGNELDVSPDVLSSLETMAISVKGDDHQLAQPALGQVSSDEGKKPGYTEKLSSTATAAKDAAVSAASTLYSTVAGAKTETMPDREDKGPSYTEKLSSTAAAAKDAALSAASTVYATVAGKDEGETHDQVATPMSTGPRMVERDREGAVEEKGSYTEKLSETALAAKDAAVSAASTVYGKVAGAGTAVMEKVQSGGGTEPSLTGYLSEKLRPGEEDRALYEVISETMQKKDEEEEGGRVIVEKKRVVLPELTSWDGVTNRDVVEEEEERVVLPGVTSREGVKKGEMSGGADGGKGMMEKIRETVTSVVGGGGGGGASDAPPPSAAVETPLDGGRGRERAREEMDY